MDRINLGSVSQILFAFPVYSCVYMVLRDNVLCFGPVGIVFFGFGGWTIIIILRLSS